MKVATYTQSAILTPITVSPDTVRAGATLAAAVATSGAILAAVVVTSSLMGGARKSKKPQPIKEWGFRRICRNIELRAILGVKHPTVKHLFFNPSLPLANIFDCSQCSIFQTTGSVLATANSTKQLKNFLVVRTHSVD